MALLTKKVLAKIHFLEKSVIKKHFLKKSVIKKHKKYLKTFQYFF